MILRTFVATLFLIASTLAAAAQDWTLERAAGDVRISTDGRSWSQISTGAVLENGSWIRTGPRSRVILARGDERIVYRADTLAAISTSEPTGQRTRVTQQRGSIFLSVETRRRKHTSVVTPHLAAVVKGTVFEVSTDRAASTVRVDRGRVEVRDESGRADVPEGRQAVSSGRSLTVSDARVTSQIPGNPNAFGLDTRPIEAGRQGPSNRSADASGQGQSNGTGGGNGNDRAGGSGNGSGTGGGNGGGGDSRNDGGSSNGGSSNGGGGNDGGSGTGGGNGGGKGN
ncbi:FecR domain-containing protein [Aestuariibius sp. 2305UL40-4]|uniref:FecR domain-containing protein n=1 Tax=Aestuariibius violaceus TaxID=3234132 RepID=UPI00345E2630